MVSNKILFLVLVGCAVSLAVPVKREVDNNEVAEQPQKPEVPEKPEAQEPHIEIEVHEITEEEFNQIYKKIKETVDKVFNEINSQINIKETFGEVKNIFDKIFGKKKDSVASDETVETVETTETVESKENSLSVESVESKESSQTNSADTA